MAKTKNVKDALVTEEKTKKSKEIKEVEVAKEEVELESEELEEVKESKKETKKEVKKETAKKETTKKEGKKSKDKKEGFISSVMREMKKVVWPSFGDILKYSFAVILFCVVLCLFFEGITIVSAFVKGLFR